jgi:excisionase family DNA binding protein
MNAPQRVGVNMEAITTSVDDAAAALGIGRTKLYQLINSGDLQTIKLGRRTLIKTASIRALVDLGSN